MNKDNLKHQLKQLIIEECDKDIAPESIDDDALLIGSHSPLELDSLDALQISLAVKQQYGVRIESNKETRKALKSVNALADFILAQQ